MIDLSLQRRFFADEIEAIAGVTTPGLIEALASVPRERFLTPGPWLVKSEADAFAPPRRTKDDDPRHVYHNYSIALDPARQLFNGAPSFLLLSIDRLALTPGARVLHVGAGPGYYTAIIARTIGPSGRLVATEVDPDLGAQAARNLSDMPWVEVRIGNSSGPLDETFDAIFVNAGVTHPQDAWLDALVPGGRIVFPLTAVPPQPGQTIGKGVQLLATKGADAEFSVRLIHLVAIYSAIDIRDERLNQEIGRSLMRNPFPRIERLRRDRHEPSDKCWLHGETFCLSL